ncbi:MAG: nitronate monooxygenase [Pseudomonadota bacterium]
MPGTHQAIDRAKSFANELGIDVPVLLAPMAGACPAALSIAVAKGGGMGACGALMMNPEQIAAWVHAMRAGSNGAFQINTWIPDPTPARDPAHEATLRTFLQAWGPEALQPTDSLELPDFVTQCEAMLRAGPTVVSSIMGLYPAEFVSSMKEQGIKWFATVTTVAEALEAERAGADVIVAQGMEAGGHRGAFCASEARANMVGLFALLPAVVDAVSCPVVATGGIADARGMAAALLLGASAVQIGTGFLRTPEAAIPAAWADAIGTASPEDTIATRAFSGRLGRSLRTPYTHAAEAPDAPAPAPYPVQRHLTQPMRSEAAKSGSLDGMQAWAGQSARMAQTVSAEQVVSTLWRDAQVLLQ